MQEVEHRKKDLSSIVGGASYLDSVLVTKLSVSYVSQNPRIQFSWKKRVISWFVYISTQHLEWGRCAHTAGKTENQPVVLQANAVKLMPQPPRGFMGHELRTLHSLECLLRFWLCIWFLIIHPLPIPQPQQGWLWPDQCPSPRGTSS